MDSAAPQLAAMLDDCTEHLAAIAADIGSGAVLVHCTQGVSRSATVVAALLMRTDCSLTAAQARCWGVRFRRQELPTHNKPETWYWHTARSPLPCRAQAYSRRGKRRWDPS